MSSAGTSAGAGQGMGDGAAPVAAHAIKWDCGHEAIVRPCCPVTISLGETIAEFLCDRPGFAHVTPTRASSAAYAAGVRHSRVGRSP